MLIHVQSYEKKVNDRVFPSKKEDFPLAMSLSFRNFATDKHKTA